MEEDQRLLKESRKGKDAYIVCICVGAWRREREKVETIEREGIAVSLASCPPSKATTPKCFVFRRWAVLLSLAPHFAPSEDGCGWCKSRRFAFDDLRRRFFPRRKERRVVRLPRLLTLRPSIPSSNDVVRSGLAPLRPPLNDLHPPHLPSLLSLRRRSTRPTAKLSA
jgi:hypothetical protein